MKIWQYNNIDIVIIILIIFVITYLVLAQQKRYTTQVINLSPLLDMRGANREPAT